MKLVFMHLFTVVLIFGVSLTGSAQKIKVHDIGAIARFVYCTPPGSDAASQTAYAACIQQNRIRNDVDRDYVNGQEGIAAVFNIVSGSNDLTINLLTVPTRRTVFDLFDLIPESSNQVLPSWHTSPQSAKTFFNVRQAYLAKSFCSGSYPCDMITVMSSTIDVDNDNSTYRLQLFPNSNLPVNSPEITSQVRVHYDVIAGVETWTITPQTNTSSGRTVAGLARQAKKSTDPAGQYLTPFTLTARLQ